MPSDAGTTSSGWADGVDIFAAAPDGIVIVDEEGTIAAVNDQVGEMFGYERTELIGQPVEILLPQRFHERHTVHRKAYTAAPARRPMGATLSLYGRRRDGEEIEVDISLNHQCNTVGELRVIAFVRDATERRRTEEALRSTEESFRLLVEGAADHAIYMLDPSGRVVTWNPGAERIKAWTADEILGRHFSVFYLPEDIASGQPERDLERAAADGRRRAMDGACEPAGNDSGPRRRFRPCATIPEHCVVSRKSRATAPRATRRALGSNRSASSTVRYSNGDRRKTCSRSLRRGPARWSAPRSSPRGRRTAPAINSASRTPTETAHRQYSERPPRTIL